MNSLNKNGWLIVAVCGVTCGGKTTLAKRLQNEFPNSVTVSQDEYFYFDDNPKHVKVPGMNHNNYDILSSLDMEKMYSDIISILSEKNIVRNDLFSKILILEGFTVLNYKPIFDVCDLKYQLVLDKDECKRRRDTRVYDPPDIPGYFEECVWPEYCRYNQELKMIDFVNFLDGTKSDLFERVLCDIKTHLKE